MALPALANVQLVIWNFADPDETFRNRKIPIAEVQGAAKHPFKSQPGQVTWKWCNCCLKPELV